MWERDMDGWIWDPPEKEGELKTSLPKQEEKTEEKEEGSGIAKPIIIRTPVLEKSNEGLDLLSNVEENKKEEDEASQTKKLITKV